MSTPDNAPKLTYVTTIGLTQWLFLRRQNRYMAARGFRLFSLCAPSEELDRLVQRDGVETWPIPFTRRITPLQDIWCLWRLIKAFRHIRPDIVHLSTPKAALLGAIAAILCRVPVRIYYVRGLFTERTEGWAQRVCRWLETITAKLCTQCIFVSPSLMKFARDRRICSAEEGMVAANGMSNGIDVEHLSPQNDQPDALRRWREEAGENACVIGFLGRLARDKGIAELAEAWFLLVEKRPETRLLLVGPIEAEDGLSAELLERLRSDDRVYMPGFVDSKEVGHYYRAMDVFVYCSWGSEGFPNAPMEAAALGRPVVVSNVVGCVDAVVPGVSGRVVSKHDVEELVRAIDSYVEDSELRFAHGQAGRERVLRDFQSEPIWSELATEYTRLIGLK